MALTPQVTHACPGQKPEITDLWFRPPTKSVRFSNPSDMVSGMKPLSQVAIQINAESMVAYGAVSRAVPMGGAVYLTVNGAVTK